MAIGLAAASLTITSIIFIVQASELASRSETINRQNEEIKQYSTLISTQKQEIANKATQIDRLNTQIDLLSSDIVSKEEEIIAAKSQHADSSSSSFNSMLTTQQTNLDRLDSQTKGLQSQISLLQAKMEDSNEKHNNIANVTARKMGLVQQSDRVKISHYAIGIGPDNKAIVFPIEVEILNSGTGAVSVDVNNVQYQASFQSAVRTAAAVASDYTGKSLSDKDIIIRLVNNYGNNNTLIKIDGPSAGAIVTAMMIAGLDGKELGTSTLVTGAINPDGSIDRVGNIDDKVSAATTFGANVIIVPETQEYRSKGILVIGASNIQEVLKYVVAS